MTHDELMTLLQRREVLLAGLALALLALIWLGRRIRKIAKSDRPDDVLSNLAMLIGLGWSSEAAWELTGRAHFPTSLRLLLFFVLETILVVSMIRAKRAMKEFGHPGRSGRTAWVVATGMAVVAVGVAGSFAEAVLRLIIPLLITNMWWDGLIGEGTRKALGATSWRWTPRRLLLAIGAVEPGERDIETVHRERLIQQMTKLYFKVQHGSPRFSERRKTRLARLSLAADDEITAAVQDRVGRATWFEPEQGLASVRAPEQPRSAFQAESVKARRALHNRRLRLVRVKQPTAPVSAVQEPEPDPRSKQEIDSAIRFIAEHPDAPSQRQIAHIVRTSPATVNRALRRKQNPSPPPPTNGRRPELEGVDR